MVNVLGDQERDARHDIHDNLLLERLGAPGQHSGRVGDHADPRQQEGPDEDSTPAHQEEMKVLVLCRLRLEEPSAGQHLHRKELVRHDGQ